MRNGVAVYEKQYVPDDWGATESIVKLRAQREVDLIKLMADSDAFGGPLGVVRIEQCDPQKATISTFEIPGKSLDQWIKRSAQAKTTQTAVELAGRWIRAFQSLPLTKNANKRFSEYDPESIRDYCELRLNSLKGYGYSWPDTAMRERILERIGDLENNCSDADQQDVWVHADFAPGNIMWDGETVTGIDFAMARSGRPLDDATYFIHRLEMQEVYRPWRSFPVQQWRSGFLREYGRPDAADSAMYQLLMAKHLVCRLHTYVRRPATSHKQAIHDVWVRQVLRRKLKQFAR
ncbi:aminoglycoside phosphotransferase family protein [Stieleria sp. TO1_6]|uniref:aminoglycoside phosphotransferase family protein n=1 Tax=Stieleria tagensis TaxID=2956795 RepID=UPI00209B2259|nr:aminoglycoside phosphotransferase family protein [Stieleria tagensis]MCO8122497.1 aminoglycoside phosphotransferase family protein [Stieleria tagensis]